MTDEQLIRKLAENFCDYAEAEGDEIQQEHLIRYAKTLIMAHSNKKLILERIENAELRSRDLTGSLGDRDNTIAYVIAQLSG